MLSVLRNAASGLVAQQWNLDVIANNMANATTPGYKRGRAEFQDLVYKILNPQAPAVAENDQVAATGGCGAALSAKRMLTAQGDLLQTGNSLDVAITGEGYFEVERPDGSRVYTRDGSFTIDDQGRLQTHSGLLVPGVTIPIDAETLGISEDGTVTVARAGSGEIEEVGRISLVTFPNPSGLLAIGENFLVPTDASGEPVASGEQAGSMVQGYLENSNVNYMEEMTKMIAAQRAYQLSARSLQAVNDMMGLANQLRT